MTNITTNGFETRYRVLNREYSVFHQEIANVDKLISLLRERNRFFTVRYATVDNETGRIISRGCEIAY